MKRKEYLIIFLLLIGYYILHLVFDITIFCPIFKLTGYFCPGCGITRMFEALFHLKIYQAFRFNPLVFILLIIFLFEKIYEIIKRKKVIIKPYLTYILLFIVILFGILRNIPGFEFLQPTYL